MADKEQIDKLTKRLYRRRQFIHCRNNYTKGSKKGYYGDLEVDGPLSSSDCDDESIAISSARDSTKSQHNFYSNIRPKRSGYTRKRQRLKPTLHHPDIDVSLVAILSSKDADQFNHHHLYHGQSILSKSSSSSSSSDCGGGTSSDSTQHKITSCEHIKKKANPIAVVDYGSMHLNMDGSLLDSIYNIGDSSHGSSSRSRTNDLLIGGRTFSALPMDNTNKGMSATEVDKASLNKEMGDSTIKTDRPISVNTGNLHQRTNGVSAIIASLKCNTDKKEKMFTNYEDEERATYIMSTTRTTLEDAISFSPFARVLICAQHPFTVVHVNAAYTTLVQQGLVKFFISVGQTFDSIQDKGRECLNEEEVLTRIVSQFKTDSIQDIRQDHMTIFPVISTNDMCSQIISSYRSNLRQLRGVDNPEIMLPSSHTKPVVKEEGSISKSPCSEYVSHYLLQIKPSMIGNL